MDWDNRDRVLRNISFNGDALRFASLRLKNDSHVVLQAVRRHGPALQYATDDVKNNADVVFAAVTQNKQSMRYASQLLKNNPSFFRRVLAISNGYLALEFASESLRAKRASEKSKTTSTVL